jgi:hypothetical protein
MAIRAPLRLIANRSQVVSCLCVGFRWLVPGSLQSSRRRRRWLMSPMLTVEKLVVVHAGVERSPLIVTSRGSV